MRAHIAVGPQIEYKAHRLAIHSSEERLDVLGESHRVVRTGGEQQVAGGPAAEPTRRPWTQASRCRPTTSAVQAYSAVALFFKQRRKYTLENRVRT